MSTLPILPAPEWPAWMQRARAPHQAGYYAMFSSLLGGIVTDPLLMQVPVDDHLVHRGDGVFETIKCVEHGIYLLGEHLDRLHASASAIGLACPWPRETLVDLVRQTVRAGGHPCCLIRILLSRGPGSMGVNPYDCPTPGLYILAHELKPSFMAQHPAGARVAISRIPIKPSFFATIKACNYLPNALMKKEAVDLGVDFTLAFDEHGRLAEGATENAGILTEAGDLRVLVNGHDATDELRTETAGAAASAIAAIPEVRAALKDRQRAFRQPPGLVADGRDMGTVIFPDAAHKVFLTASAEERAERRYKQLKDKGVSVTIDGLLR